MYAAGDDIDKDVHMNGDASSEDAMDMYTHGSPNPASIFTRLHQQKDPSGTRSCRLEMHGSAWLQARRWSLLLLTMYMAAAV